MNSHRAHAFTALLTFAVLSASVVAQGTPVGFEETYALASDRAQAVAALIPGTEDAYYYSCRERLDARDFAAVQKILPAWIRRHGRTARVVEIENREALLNFAPDPKRTFTFLRDRLGLRFDHQRVVPGDKSDLPSRLDPAALSNETLTRRALQLHPDTVDGFTEHALPGLAQTALDLNHLHSLLGRLTRPDVDNLPALIIRDLDHPSSGGFGSLEIHNRLLRPQLEECLRLRPALLQEPRFVTAFLRKLQPGGDTAWQDDPAERQAQLTRLWEFAQRLPPAFNSLKAHVLFHWLEHDLSQGAPDKDRFMAYIRLPRRAGHASEQHLRRHQRADEYVDSALDLPTGLRPIGDDEALVRACLESFFATEDSYAPYAEFLRADWLEVVLAETKIQLGQGNLERWSAMLGDPGQLDRLERRVDIVFARTSRTRYAAGDPVRLDVLVKNVPTLLVKVFAIDGYRYHVEREAEVDAGIDLDGVVPNFEQTYAYSEPPLRRVLRSFDLPMLSEPGTYVVECVGNGLSSRAVVHKGHLRAVERTTAAGQVFRVYDEAGVHRKGAGIWLGGRDYLADAEGDILLPFSTDPGGRTVVLHEGNRSSLAAFDHEAESFRLDARVHVDRESLVAGKKARIIVRAELRISGRAASLSLLTQPVLTIVATDLDGLETEQAVRDLVLVDGREVVHEITVPERLAVLRARLSGRVKDLAGKDVDLETRQTAFAVNGIDLTAATSGVQLLRTPEGFALEIRGKDGEPKAGHVCNLGLQHRDYRDPVAASLQADPSGRVHLGALPGIERIQVRLANGYDGTFEVPGARFRPPTELHALAGETLRVPYQGAAKSPSRDEFSLIGTERDEFARLALADGFLELRGLEPGNYDLTLHDVGATIRVRITRGVRNGSWLVGRDRVLEAGAPPPLQLRSLAMEGDDLVVRVANASKGTRLHVVATRFAPPFDAFRDLLASATAEAAVFDTNRPKSTYHSGRKLGDEYRYMLERRFAKKFPGNMLRRPSLLLNPWAIDDDSKNEAPSFGGPIGAGSGGRGGTTGGHGGGAPGSPGANPGPPPGAYANVDYLPGASLLLANLLPDQDGVVRVKAADLGDGQIVHVLAIDGSQSVYDSIVRQEKKLQPRARHLAKALDASQHLVEAKRIQFVAGGGEAVLDDARAARVEVYDSLSGVYRVLSTICPDPSLPKFAFILQWPKLPPEQKRALYAAHACHELHFFLFRKDPEFFRAVVRPFLVNKLDKTFLDHWLLGDDLSGYLETWSFAQLNLIEKILLAQRLDAAQQAAAARFVREGLELRPIPPQQIEQLFRLALAGKDLDREKGGVYLGMGPDSAPVARPDVAKAGAAEARGFKKEIRAEDAKEREAAAEKSSDMMLGDDRERRKLVEEAARRGELARLFRAVDPTKVFAEQAYWRRKMEQTTPDVVAPNHFWADYATARPGQAFVSASVLQTGGSFLEAMFALSVLDLPFEPGKHDVVADGERRTLRAATPLLLVRKEFAKAERAADQQPLLLGENFLRLDDRYRFENGEKRDAFVVDEFLVDVAYVCQIVVTNPTSGRRTVEVLVQIPEGALPVNRGFWTRGVAVELQPYATSTIEYAFYFPAPGDFPHYPAQAAEKGRLAAAAEPRVLHAVVTPSRIDTSSWEHVSQLGSAAEVMAYVDGTNVQRLDLARLAWRMRDRDFFASLLPKLRDRHVYLDVLWSYAILHQDADASREYLRHADAFVHTCGAALRSPLLTIDPKERREFQHLELEPLVHARAHALGKQRIIGNADLARQYARFMEIIGYHERLDAADWIAVTYYLLLQDRVEEGLAAFAKIDPNEAATKIQYDYLQAYIGFFTGDVAGARRIADRYRDYPVDHWKKRFADVVSQLDEAEGKASRVSDGSADTLAAQAPSLELALEGRQARISYRNLAQCEVRYYELDVEFAFSAQPFASEEGTSAAFVRPNLSEPVDLPEGRTEVLFELPAPFHKKNVLVEVRGKGLVRSRTYFANALNVRFLESWGQVAVTETGGEKPLPQAYVKVFAKLSDGTVRFHKDGYTDIRGRFDYASLSDDPNLGADRYAVLVLSEQRGAVIREVKPPAR